MSVAIYGAGHLGRQVLHHLRAYYPQVHVHGYVDDVRPAGETVVDDLQVLGPLSTVMNSARHGPGELQLVFAIGYGNMPARGTALARVRTAGYTLFDIVHPRAYMEPGTRAAGGLILLAGAIIDQNVSLGAGCFVDIGVRIGEDSVVGDNTYFSSGAAIGGTVSIGDGCFLGMDSTVTTGVEVGSNCFINAKTLVARTVPDNTKLVEIHKTRELPFESA